jgi:5-methylcytosine-specific restriction enzyme subunit McrC
MTHVAVREHALLSTGDGVNDLDHAFVSPSALSHLTQLSARLRSGGAPLVQFESGTTLRVDNYVGVVETPCGTVLEVLPKHVPDLGQEESSRRLLIKMLKVVLNVQPREVGEADIQLMRRPLTEWVMRRFVESLERLIKRGLRSDYVRIEEEERFLRGQLDVGRYARQPAGRQHFFSIRHDIFSPDGAENRLLKLAVSRVRARTRDSLTWRLAAEHENLMADIRASEQVASDFRRWRNDRLMTHYSEIRKWCELVLGTHMPAAQAGSHRGLSLLFPMERLFESYVAKRMSTQLAPGVKMTSQASSRAMCVHQGNPIFQLRPDMLLEAPDNRRWVLDTKWKLLDRLDVEKKYGLNQSDFYQLHAYGHKYLAGSGDLFLIYPRTHVFDQELDWFNFSESLRLRVAPFDLETDQLMTSAAPFIRDDVVGGQLRSVARNTDAQAEN